MTTKFQNSEEIRKAFLDLLSFKSLEEEIKHNAQMIMYRFLSEIEILSEEKKMTKKQLAEKIGTSASYITQLYRGNKPLNIETIAKFQKVFDITFDIKAKPNSLIEIQEVYAEQNSLFPDSNIEPDGFWYFKNFQKNKNSEDVPCQDYNNEVDIDAKSAA
jgi:transcriptional regulator with XRE-family HTH domain